MSVEAVTWVLDYSPERLANRLVLIVLAEHADKRGEGARPAAATIARRACISEAQAWKSLAHLRKVGAIEKTGVHKSGASVYRVQMTLSNLEGLKSRPSQSETSPLQTLEVYPSKVETRTVLNHPEPPSNGNNPDVKIVYDAWREKLGKRDKRYDTLSAERRKKITARLTDGYTAAQLCAAIDAVAADDWPDRPKHNDIPIIFRSREKVDYWLDRNATPARCQFGGSNGLTPHQMRTCGCKSCTARLEYA